MLKRMTNGAAAALFALIVALSVLAVSCETSVDADPSLAGTWVASSDGFTVTATTFTYYYPISSMTESYSGTIVSHSDYTDSSGYITIKVTSTPGSYTPTVDNYYVLYWSGLSDSGVAEGGAAKSYKITNPDGTKTIVNDYYGNSDQATAESTYTVENGYFSYLGQYTRQ